MTRVLLLTLAAPLLLEAQVTITTSFLDNATLGQPYNFQMMETGGTPPVFWSQSGLPSGLDINPNTGLISGTPLVNGSFGVTITVSDGMCTGDMKMFLLFVADPLTITNTFLDSGTVGTPYGQQMTAGGSDYVPPLMWSQSGLPSGLDINPGTGLISGTPLASGQFMVTITVVDSNQEVQAMAMAEFSLTIFDPLVITTAALPTATVGQPYSFQMMATGGDPPYFWGQEGLPNDFNMSESGLITGTPTMASSVMVAFFVSDGMENFDEITLQLTVASLAITTESLPDGTVGQAYNASVAAAGGTPPYSFSWSNQPPGLMLSAGGMITGTPTSAGSYTPTITVMDYGMVIAEKDLGLLVNSAPLMITTASLPAGNVGQAYNASVIATGGTPPYSFTWNHPPPGLILSASGMITGTPTLAGNYTPAITVRDSEMARTEKDLGLLVNPPPLVITTASLPNGSVGVAYDASVSATGGTPPYSFSWSNQPPGLMLSAAGMITGIPTSTGTFNIHVTVDDSAERHGSKTYSVLVQEPLTFLTDSLPPAKAGDTYSTTIFAGGGTPPYTFSFDGPAPPELSLSSSGTLSGPLLSAGTIFVSVRVADDSGASISRSYVLSVENATDSFQLSVSSLKFSTSSGGDPPPAQSFTIVRQDGKTSSYAVSIETLPQNALPVRGARAAATSSWLTVDPGSGQVPARMTVAVDPTGLTPGTYMAQMSISAPDSPSRLPKILPISLTLESAPPQLDVSSSPLKFAAETGSTESFSGSLLVRNSGGGGPLSFNVTVAQGSSWVASVTPASGQTTPGAPVAVQVRVDPTGLAPGQYLDAIQVSSASGSVSVPVALFVSPPGPRLDLSVVGVRFRIRQGSSISIGRHVSVINRGGPGTILRWTADILEGADWLALPVSSGIAAPDDPDDLAIRLKDTVSAFPPGPYYGLIRVSDRNALGSPRYITVVLEVAPFAAPTTLDFETKGSVLVAAPGSATPQTVTFDVGTSSVTPVAFQAAASTYNGGAWLSVSPLTGSVSSASNAKITVTANASKLSAGVYRGEVDVARASQVQSLNITLIVAETGSPAADGLKVRAAECVPRRLVVTQTGLANHFTVPAGWPATMMVRINNDCGGVVREATAVSSFSNGDPPLTLIDDGTGAYWATWQPGGAADEVNVTVRASGPGLAPDSAVLIGDITQNPAPVLTPDGTLHNLNPKIGGALSPGLVVQIYGGGLAGTTGSTGQVPLANAFSGTYVLVGPYQAPLYYVSPGQLVAQLPSELVVNQQYPVVVVANGAITLPQLVDVVPVEPGVAAFPDGTLIAQHADFSLVDAAHPARRGDSLVMYLAGLGETTPAVASGQPSPSSPLAVPKVLPTLTIDGQAVDIQFVGLTPGAVGLFQINFAVPQNARTGVPLDVVVEQGGVSANVTKLTIVE